MSYDTSIRCEHCDSILGDYRDNFTYNLGPMFRWCLGGDGLNDLNGVRGGDAGEKLRKAIALCEADVTLFRFDATNGYGTAIEALEFLHGIEQACVDNPYGIVRIS